MKKLEFKITVPDKYTGKEYKAGEVYSFEDKRADEILKARTQVTNEPYAVEFVEEIVEQPEEEVAEIMDLKTFKVDELKEIARLEGIEGFDKMKKAELIEALENKQD